MGAGGARRATWGRGSQRCRRAVGRRGGGRSVVASLVGVVAVLGLVVGGCSDGDGSAPTTTTDPLAAAVVDACGNDLSAATSTAWGVDPATGAVRWRTPLPLAEGYVVPEGEGPARVPLVLRSVAAALDVATGEVGGYPPAGVHEVLVDDTGVVTGAAGTVMVDGTAQPAAIVAAGVVVRTAARPDGGLALVGVDDATDSTRWDLALTSVPLPATGLVGHPVLLGDTVVVVVPDAPRPPCPPAS